MRSEDQFMQPRFRHLEVAVVTGLASEILKHRRRAAHERSISKDLCRAVTKPVVTEPGVHAKVE